MAFSFKEILNRLTGESFETFENGKEFVISKPASITDADEESMIWIKPGTKDISGKIQSCKASLIVCNKEMQQLLSSVNSSFNFLIVDEPKRIFSKLVNALFVTNPKPGIHPTAFIEKDAVIGSNCYIGPFTYIGKAVIGDNAVIHGHVHIHDKITIGKNCVLHAGVVIGSDGFGFSKDAAGTPEKFPHVGSVIIGNDVEVGANSCIDRGSLGNTIIHDHVKIDNLVHVAHNVVIHSNAFIIANTVLGGSVVIEENAWIAPSVTVKQQLRIGKNAVVGMGAVVTKNIPADETWLGNPAKEISAFIKDKNGGGK